MIQFLPTVLFLITGAGAGEPACIPVTSDRILARDLVSAVPEMAVLPAGVSFGLAPSPGVKRFLSGHELRRIAQRYGIERLSAPELICVAWRSRALRPSEVIAALTRSLPVGASLELQDFSRQAVPPGVLEFRPTGLSRATVHREEVPATWRGKLLYAPGRNIPVWARVRIAFDRNQVTASEELRPGIAVRPEQLKVGPVTSFAFDAPVISTTAEIAGKVPRRTIRAGEPIRAQMLRDAPDLRRGDRVEVEVRSGTAQLRLEARAETEGRTGDNVRLRNPETGRRFEAVVAGAGKATVNVRSTP
jgi:flagella basal body P-ring formation protein FlgA